MHRTHLDEFSEDLKESVLEETQHQNEIAVKSRFHITMNSDICSDLAKTNCVAKTSFLNNALPYASHVVKCSSPDSNIVGETISATQFGPHSQLHISQGQALLPPSADLSFYSIPDILSDQERLNFSDAEKFLRSKEADMCDNEYKHLHDEFAVRKYYHPLYAHGICRWPGCEMDLEDIASFVKHLNSEHGLDDRSTAQARVQMQVVSQLESHLQKERDRLQAMMHHLYLSKQLLTPIKTDRKALNDKQAVLCSNSITMANIGHPFQQASSPGSLNLPIVNAQNVCSGKKRSIEKNTFSVTGGLPYMLERAGLDVQQEIQRNRDFYKNADVRPPFTYASLIRQAIIDSPDKQLTLNEIYNWFQNTFCYFRRNAATWKNAIRTNLSLHKCFVRYEDDFGSFWMVDDNEFVKRRHLSRGRPRKYEPSSSPNSCQSGSAIPPDKDSCDNCSQHCANICNESGNLFKMHKTSDFAETECFDICNRRQSQTKIETNLYHEAYTSESLNSKNFKRPEATSADLSDYIGVDYPSSIVFQDNNIECNNQSP